MTLLKTWFSRGRTPEVPDSASNESPGPAVQAPAGAWHRIADLLARGNAAEALVAAQEAADRFPDDVRINVLLGDASLAAGDAEGALDAYLLASHYSPGEEGALRGRIKALARLGRAEEIPGVYLEFLEERPDHPGALLALARIACDAGDHGRGLSLLEHVVDLHPDNAAALNDLGLLVAREFADFPRGETLLRRALEVSPDATFARTNLGWVLCEQRAYEEGFALLDEAIALHPDDHEARLIRALSRLKRGDFANGWDEYDSRFASPTARRRPFDFPLWDGAPLHADRLLIYGEQGLGDQIMFVSCLPDVLARVSDCVVECEPKLGALVARSFPAARVVTGPLRESVPDWLKSAGPLHRQIALGSLPRLFRRSPADFPAHSGYLRADPARVRFWRDRLDACGPGPKIGISWRGGTKTSRRGLRSLDLPQLAPLMAGHQAVWVSLQYGDCAAELAAFSQDTGVRLHHWREAIDDYDETAALVCALDLVISVCTSVIHLTGSLGRPALVMVPYAAEWRYGAEGEAMPWYPSVRLLRQRAPDRWDEVFEALRRELLTCATDGTW